MPASDHPRPIGPWPPRLKHGLVRLITPDELKSWIVFEDETVFVVNKPGDFVCHPSKDGPWSSLVGASREHLQVTAVHMAFRLDRETSGLVIFGKDPETGRRLQMAAQDRRYAKSYLSIHFGEMREKQIVDQSLGDDLDGPVSSKSKVVPAGQGQTAHTEFEPIAWGGGFTLCRVTTGTGRKHQIRVHAHWLGFPLVGDKIYGPDPQLFIDFVEDGWSALMEEKLLMRRQALHCAEIDLRPAGLTYLFHSEMAADMAAFCRNRMGVNPATLVIPRFG